VTRLGDAAGAEALLITGGPYQYMAKCPTFGCLAWVIDRDGKVLHTWEADLDALFRDVEGFRGDVDPDTIYPIGTSLQDDGSLVMTFHARNTFPYQVGIARIGPNGEIIWKHWDYSHHWIDTDAQGRIYAPSMKLVSKLKHFENTPVEVKCHTGTLFYEGIRIYAADGSVLRDIWIEESFARSGYPGLLYSLRDGCDPAHVNSVEVVRPEIAAVMPGVEAGDLLVSIREPSAIAIIDAGSGLIKHIVVGRTAGQHSPHFLPDGTVVVFDNQGGDRALGGTRILRIDLLHDTATTVYPGSASDPLLPFWSRDGGTIAVSPDGERIMISVKKQARTLEIDLTTGSAQWLMEKSFDISPFLEMKNKQAEADHGYFNAYGAYYLDNGLTF
jgi:hypothetical protein